MHIIGNPVLNPVAPYGYILPTVYLFMADIANPDLFVCGLRTWICLNMTRFDEEQRQPSSRSAWPPCPKNSESCPYCYPICFGGGMPYITTRRDIEQIVRRDSIDANEVIRGFI